MVGGEGRMKGNFINGLRGLFQPSWFCNSGGKKKEVKWEKNRDKGGKKGA